jgi:hypothetical protein
MGSPSRNCPLRRIVAVLTALLLTPLSGAQTQPVQATTVPLILPGGLLAFDSSGNLYFAETSNHVVRRVTPLGILTTVAGTGTQGFAGDLGAATSAQLDSPLAVALDSTSNLYIADSHNHRIRRVDSLSGTITTVSAQFDLPTAIGFDPSGNLVVADARTHLIQRIDHATGTISTVAGNGTQGFSGDQGAATQASIDSPYGIAFDAAGNLYFSDTHNNRIRRVDHTTGSITSVAGTNLGLPRGLAADASGNLFIVDASNQRIRRIDATTGQITNIAGQGTQAYLGDNGPAVSASLNAPRAVAISPAGLPTIADTANERIRQIDSAANIHTIAGLGTTVAGTLTLTAPAVSQYGTGALTATLIASPATGSITFFDAGQSLGSGALANNAATLSASTFAAAAHRFFATYPGDTLHSPAQSTVLSVTISPAPLSASPAPVSILYGQPVPLLTGALSGVLPQDAGLVTLSLSSLATPTTAPGSYPITASVSGSQAANYTLSQSAAAVLIAKAPSTITLSNTLAAHVASTTSGQPAGTVSLYDAGAFNSNATINANGDATFSSATLSIGTHTLTATYNGDVDFVAATSAPVIATIGPTATADFSLASTGQSAVTVQAGTAAQFSFAVNPLNGSLSSPILLTVSGLPSGATATFNPTYLPPTNTPAAFILTIQTPKTASLVRPGILTFALMVPLGLLLTRRTRRRLVVAAALALTLGCGDRINNSAATAASATYNITVNATATSNAGTTLQHTAGVTLTVR